MWRSDVCKTKSVSGLRLASRWLLALSCVCWIALWSRAPLCVLVAHYSLCCLQFASEPWNPVPWLWLCSTMRHQLRRRSICCHTTAWWHFHPAFKATPLPFLLKKYIRSLRSQENQFTSCSLWVWRVMRWLLSSRKMYIFAEDRNWLFFFFILHPSLHQCLIWIHGRWHPSSFFFNCCTDVAPSFYSLSNSYIWTVKPRGHKQPVAQINLLLEKEAYF